MDAWLEEYAGGRVAYRVAGEAHRQALARARDADLTLGDLKVFQAVLAATVSYSKLSDRLPLDQIETASGCSARQTGRSLAKLARRGIIGYRPGRGRGVVGVVGVPPAEESGQIAVHFSPAKSGQDATEKWPDQAPKSGQIEHEKVATHTRARKSPRSKPREETPRREEIHHVCSSSSRDDRASDDRVNPNGNAGTSDTTITDEEQALVEAIIAAFNEVAGTQFTARAFLPMILARVREWPMLREVDHRKIIEATVSEEWVTDPLPNVVYGRMDTFEVAVHRMVEYQQIPREEFRKFLEAQERVLSGAA